MRLGPSTETLRAWEAERSKRFERFSGDELRKKLKDIDERLDSLKLNLPHGKIEKQGETNDERQRLEEQRSQIAIELFMRKAWEPAPPGVVGVRGVIGTGTIQPNKVESSSDRDSGKTMKGSGRRSTAADNIKMRVGQNIEKLKKESGWSFDKLAEKTGIDKKTILSHVHGKSKPHPKTQREYAQAFAKELNRAITANNLEE